MNLLPKHKEDFSDKSYWDSFFKNRGNKAFEWYGEYTELCDYIDKYIKHTDEILIAGCGNSTLGNDLYDVGYCNITSIDISSVAIKKMLQMNSKSRPKMKFIEMDATNTTFESESYSTVIDKGTLDALMSSDSQEVIENSMKYLTEMLRVLKFNGRFICISLLQEHILKNLLNFLVLQNCLIRVIRCYAAEQAATDAGESTLPVFMIVATKFTKLPGTGKLLEVNMGGSTKFQRFTSENAVFEVIQLIQQVQHAAFVCAGLQKTRIEDDDVSFELYNIGEKLPKYTVYVVDGKAAKGNKKYAAFIAPQGRESEWLFSTKEGRHNLAETAHVTRLAVVVLNRKQTYESLDAIQEEITDAIRNLAPPNLGNEKILFMTLGNDLGERKIVCEGSSSMSGDYIVEDVIVDGDTFRRLYFMNSQFVIQSEAKLKMVNDNGLIVDSTFLSCAHHIYMNIFVHALTKLVSKQRIKIAIVGLGGGGLCTFLRQFCDNVDITAVEIDPSMLDVAKKHFGLKTDKRVKVEIADGLYYLEVCKENEVKYDAILFDVDNKDTQIGMSCPPKEFLEDNVLSNVNEVLDEGGIFIVNLVLRNKSLHSNVTDALRKRFVNVFGYKLQHDLNEIIVCTKSKIARKKLRNTFDSSVKTLNNFLLKHKHKDLIVEATAKELAFYDEIND